MPIAPMMDRIFPLKASVKTYAWGKLGDHSLVGRLATASDDLDDFEVTASTPCAELWMGSHPSGMSMVTLASPWRTVTPLSEWVKLNPSLLGPARRGRRGDLPFLFKILSVRTALSIQAHPDKALAAKLHLRAPDMYRDDNHKPEMSIAITPFEALCSFQPAYSILENLRATPELVSLVGEDVVRGLEDATAARAAAVWGDGGSPRGDTATLDVADAAAAAVGFRAALRALFHRLMTAAPDRVKLQLDALMRRIESTNDMLRAPIDCLAMRLHEQYPADCGVFCVYLLNFVRLQPGEALFMDANEPHAYISGDCAEVMATSDNVVRAGLTQKMKDVDTLCDMLTYKDGAPEFVTPTREEGQPHVWRYAPPPHIEEFVLERVELPDTAAAAATLGASDGLAILIVVSGSVSVEQLDENTEDAVGLRHQLSAGAVHLVCPHTLLRIYAQEAPALLFKAAAKALV